MPEPKRHTLRPGVTVQELVPQRGTDAVQLDADTEVLCIHRGSNTLEDGKLVVLATGELHETRQPRIAYVGDIEDKWDSIPFVIAPGYFKTKYGPAKHFRDRAVVPGSRNPETHHQTSFIAIIGTVDMRSDGSFVVTRPVDDPREWEKFNEAERHEYEGAVEALDRENMVNPIDRDVTLVDTADAIAGRHATSSRVKGGKGPGRGGRGKTDITVTDPDVMKPIPPEDNPVVREAQTAAAESDAVRGRRG